MNKTYDTKDLTLATYLLYNDIMLAEPYDKDTQSWIFIDVERIIFGNPVSHFNLQAHSLECGLFIWPVKL